MVSFFPPSCLLISDDVCLVISKRISQPFQGTHTQFTSFAHRSVQAFRSCSSRAPRGTTSMGCLKPIGHGSFSIQRIRWIQWIQAPCPWKLGNRRTGTPAGWESYWWKIQHFDGKREGFQGGQKDEFGHGSELRRIQIGW